LVLAFKLLALMGSPCALHNTALAYSCAWVLAAQARLAGKAAAAPKQAALLVQDSMKCRLSMLSLHREDGFTVSEMLLACQITLKRVI
jgi:hypothetical protein